MKLFGPSTFIFILICGFTYYKYDEYKNRPPAPPTRPVQSAPAAKAAAPSANPLNAFKEAKNIIDKADAARRSAYGTVAAMDPNTASSDAATPPPPAATPSAVTVVTSATPKPAPTIASLVAPITDLVAKVQPLPLSENVIQAPVAVDGPKPNAAFAKWAAKLQIRGMRFGTTPRVFIGSVAYEVGELVEPQLGIVFDGYNAETRFLSFKDRTGAIVEIRH